MLVGDPPWSDDDHQPAVAAPRGGCCAIDRRKVELVVGGEVPSLVICLQPVEYIDGNLTMPVTGPELIGGASFVQEPTE